MIDDKFDKLHSIVNNADGLSDTTKSEILDHLAAVRMQAGGDSQPPVEINEEEDIPAVTGTARALGRLAGAVEGLEASHPQITAMVNSIATALANIGI